MTPAGRLLAVTVYDMYYIHMYYKTCGYRASHSFLQYLSDIQEHLGVTIPEVDKSFIVPVNEFDGKITYGEKKREEGFISESHTSQLEPSVELLAKIEKMAQTTFLTRSLLGKWQL